MSSSETRPRRLIGSLVGLSFVALITVGVALFVRGRAAVDDLNAQLALLQQADDPGETLYEWAGDDARTEAAALRGLSLPAEAGALQLARQGRLRPIYWLRFQLPEADIDAFLASTCIGRLDENHRTDFLYGVHPDIIANLPWWQPDDAQRVAGGECADDTGIRYRLLADLDLAAITTVYLEIAPEQR